MFTLAGKHRKSSWSDSLLRMIQLFEAMSRFAWMLLMLLGSCHLGPLR
jgi:hypothetical protein